MEITFLGTGSMVPTIDRNSTGILISCKDENILVDCGEGTQKQFRYANISPAKITRILITHWHGDHIFGLPGLLTTIAKFAPKKTLDLYGPVGSRKYLEILLSSYVPLNPSRISIHEITNDGIFFENKDFKLNAFKLEHTSMCLGYSIIEKDKRNINMEYLNKFGLKQHPILKELQKGNDIIWNKKKILSKNATTLKSGKKISIVLDSKLCQNIIKNVKCSDVLICEATLGDEFKEKAEAYKHLTASQAGLIAKNSDAKKLIITHFSQRYKDVSHLVKESRKIFKNTIEARDLLKVLV